MDMSMDETPSISQMALLGSYVPRRCGIGTFTKDLHDAIASNTDARTMVIAMDDRPEGYAYPPEVRFQIQANRLKDYQTAAEMLNINKVDLVCVQHEFGIYGGRAGEDVVAFLRDVRMPVLTTLHTVLDDPGREQEAAMRKLINHSDRLVVMCETAQQILQDGYDVPSGRIEVIGHGIPDMPFTDTAFYKDQFGLEGRPTMLTFGLLSPGKGLELVIKALPKIVEQHPDFTYVVLGAIHPHVYKKDGNAYLISLQRLAERLGVRDNVIFHTRYVSIEELCGYLGASDFFVTPYPNKKQIVSGALAYALGAGKSVLSTPYWYAEEMLAEDRGRLFPFGDSDALAREINALMADPAATAAMRKNAYMYCRPMVWSEVGKRYYRLGQEVLHERAEKPKPVFHSRVTAPETSELPLVNLKHLRTLTDDTAIFQHAVFDVPNRFHGYCSDDTARALVAAVLHQDVTGDNEALPLAKIYLSFLHHAFNWETGRFRNFMSYDRAWLEEEGSEDVHGRCIWGLGLAASLSSDDGVMGLSSYLFSQAIQTVDTLTAPRAWAFALVGIHAYLRRFSGDSVVRRTREQLARQLHQAFVDNASEDWPWLEDYVTYDNAKLPHALILSGQWLPDSDMLDQGLESLEWLCDQQLNEEGRVSLIGNDGWMTRDGRRARFDQQPVDAMALVEACAEAHRSTQDAKWARRAHLFLGWFLGNNDTESMLYNSGSRGCRDGLQIDGPNLNEGAESTLAWLIALLNMHQLRRESATGVSRDVKELAPVEQT